MTEVLRAGPAEEPDRYTLWAVMGGGAEGRVYRATRALDDGHLDVAVKVMSPDRFGSQGQPAEQVVERWVAQAARLRNLRHPGLVGVQEAFIGPPPHIEGAAGDGTVAYFVMAWVEGREFGGWFAGKASAAERLAVLDNVADALDELHSAGQVHADVKPGNILVRATQLPTGGVVESGVLVDFGLMRAISGTPPTQVAYTTGYAAPELGRGGAYSPVSDLYAFAGVVYYALSGAHPPPAEVAGEEGPRRLVALGMPPAVVAAVASGLHPDPAQRARGCRAWLANARGSLSSQLATATIEQPVVGAAAGATPSGESSEPAKKKRFELSLLAKITIPVAITIGGAGVAAVQTLDKPDAPAAAPTTTSTTEEPTTTADVSTTTTDDLRTTTTLGSLGGPVTAGQTFLVDVDAVEDAWSAPSELRMDGDRYLHGLVSPHIQGGRCASLVRSVEYSIDRGYSDLSGVVGLSDASKAGRSIQVELLGDGRSLWTGTVQVGQPQRISLDVTGVLRLKVVATSQFDTDEDGDGSCDTVYAGLGDFTLT